MNGIGHESANGTITAGRTLAWLQDLAATDVWSAWAVTYRDVILLNDNNEPVGVYNLTSNDLGDPTKYAALRDMLVSAATP